jgi:BASS family bile acid:Na+ symporter
MLARFNALFPLWAILIAIAAFLQQETFAALSTLIVPLLATVMFIMGLTLKRSDFTTLWSDPKPVLVGVCCQFLVMPLIALTLANLLQLSAQLTAGMVLVGSCAGGTASNVITYLAKGDVALSISMTIASTLVGVLATPLLCSFYLAQTIEVDTLGLLLSIVQVVLLPVSAGFLVNLYLGSQVDRMAELLPSIAISGILFIIGIVVALNADNLLSVGLLTLIAVVLHNCCGLMAGFYISRLFGYDLKRSHTIAIEVGMQNSGLGVTLALEFFSATAALPGAIFSIWHNISGSLLASHWGRNRDSLDYLLRDNEHSLADADKK